jgi:predicted DNA-binding protein
MMYPYITRRCWSVKRTQILFEEEQYERLRSEAERTGRSMGSLVREAVAQRYGGTADDFADALEASFGSWIERDFDGHEWVERGRGGLDRPIGETS